MSRRLPALLLLYELTHLSQLECKFQWMQIGSQDYLGVNMVDVSQNRVLE